MRRGLLAAVALVLGLGAVATPACFSPQRPPCAFSCARDQACPADYSCGGDGFCHRVDGVGAGACQLTPPDGATAPDGSSDAEEP
jgi:hypothetical protein